MEIYDEFSGKGEEVGRSPGMWLVASIIANQSNQQTNTFDFTTIQNLDWIWLYTK